MRILDSKVRQHPGAYVAQCGLAMIVLMVLFTIEDVLAHAAIFAAIGSPIFIIFATRNNSTTTPRCVIGGHFVGMVISSMIALVLASAPGMSLQTHGTYIADLFAALSVGLAIFVMALTDTGHPPAAGTALGLVLVGYDMRIVGFVITAAVVLAVVHRILRFRLKDLT